MDLIDYNKVMEALDKEKQLLLDQELYAAEHILVHHAINVVAGLPIIQQPEIVRCKDCIWYDKRDGQCEHHICFNNTSPDWYCADGERR